MVGLIRRACGGETEEETGGGDNRRTTVSNGAGVAKPPPPRIAFELALQVCVLCARPDAGLEILSLMISAGLQPPIEAYKVRRPRSEGPLFTTWCKWQENLVNLTYFLFTC